MRWRKDKQHRQFPWAAWGFVGLTIVVVACLLRFINLTPQVDSHFFFANHDPHYQADARISQLFERKDSQLIVSITGDIHSASYLVKTKQLTNIIRSFEGAISVKSISEGPRDLADALKSPFWRRILIANNKKSSNIVIILDESKAPHLVPRIEHVIQSLQSEDFKIRISGFPYIVELIRRHLLIDLNLFSSLAFLIFSLAVVMIFHSWRILLGMIVTCLNAGAIAFMINHLLHIQVGILTANLATIIFVLTLSHIVFLTFNWKHCHRPHHTLKDRSALVKEAVAITLPASFWSMFTTLLGFMSLLIVPAKPLRELGICGSVGTLVAFTCAYGIYPTFLRLKILAHDWVSHKMRNFYHRSFRMLEKNYTLLVMVLMGILIITTPHLWQLNTDPSLLAFFDKNNAIYEGLEYIDQNGGSAPLIVVVRDQKKEPLNTRKMMRRLWTLQEDLENHRDVGTVISLPALIAETKRHPLSFLFSSEKIFQRLERAEYDHIATSFISADRQSVLFLLRMNEAGRTNNRITVINTIKNLVRQHQFDPHLVGGIYALQGYFSQHTASSLLFGLIRLIAVFTIIAFCVARSWRIALAMTLSLSLIPLALLGSIGYFKIPLDMISAPAANVAIAMGIDAMIHLTHGYRRLATKVPHHYDDWLRARRRLWEPILTSMFIICLGFGIFFFSSFPPTRRFGGSIVFGSLMSAIIALFIFPLLAKKHKGQVSI